jgi:hypothetical protein
MTSRHASLVLFLTCALAQPLLAEPLTLRINDGTARPGGVLAVTLRTYSPRGVGQGQICFRVLPTTPPVQALAGQTILTALESFEIFSETGDVEASGLFDGSQQMTVVEFSSALAGVNRVDGPLAVFFFRVAADVAPGTQFKLELDSLDVFLKDKNGQAIPLDLRSGDFEVRDASAAVVVSAEGDVAAPGGLAIMGFGTAETLALEGGQVDFRYDPSFFAALPTVKVDPRYGTASTTVLFPESGLVRVLFSSPPTFGEVPGSLFEFRARLRTDLAIGATSTVSLDATTTLIGAGNDPLLLELNSDIIEVELAQPLFADGFESGSSIAWSSASP